MNKLRLLFTVYAIPSLVILAVGGSPHLGMLPVRDLLGDPTSIAGLHPLVGAVSNLGVLMWCACATVCLLGYSILRGASDRKQTAGFLAYFGLVTAILALDDLFLIHEHFLPQLFNIGSEILLFYPAAVAWGLVHYRSVVLRTDLVLLLSAGVFLATSVAVDQFVHSAGVIYEDGPKLLGIAGWLGYFAKSVKSELSAG